MWVRKKKTHQRATSHHARGTLKCQTAWIIVLRSIMEKRYSLIHHCACCVTVDIFILFIDFFFFLFIYFTGDINHPRLFWVNHDLLVVCSGGCIEPQHHTGKALARWRPACSPPPPPIRTRLKPSKNYNRGKMEDGPDIWSQHLQSFYWWKEKSAVWPSHPSPILI